MTNYTVKAHRPEYYRNKYGAVLYYMPKLKRDIKWLKRKRYLYRSIGAWDVLIHQNIHRS